MDTRTHMLHQDAKELINKTQNSELLMLLDLKERDPSAPALAAGDRKLFFF